MSDPLAFLLSDKPSFRDCCSIPHERVVRKFLLAVGRFTGIRMVNRATAVHIGEPTGIGGLATCEEDAALRNARGACEEQRVRTRLAGRVRGAVRDRRADGAAAEDNAAHERKEPRARPSARCGARRPLRLRFLLGPHGTAVAGVMHRSPVREATDGVRVRGRAPNQRHTHAARRPHSADGGSREGAEPAPRPAAQRTASGTDG